MPRLSPLACAIAALCTATVLLGAAEAPRPNVLVILADDLGYGDVRCNNPSGKIPTPQLDRLASEGIRFTDAHTTSSVCTPTRYSLLTGRYNWRSRLQRGVLEGFSPPLIEPGRLTLAELLRRNGYDTGCIGKWHLGLDWPRGPRDAVDYSRPIGRSPTSLGFASFFGISASLDMPPYTWIDGDRVTAAPSVVKDFGRKGPAAAEFEAVKVLPTLASKAEDFIADRARAARDGKPFFLYLALTSPHTPIAPSAAWRGKSGISPYADFVMQTDACVGQVLGALDTNGLRDNTLVVFTSDNGCSPAADIGTLRAKGHEPNGPFRGTKADVWDGGHRVPFLVRWPGKVKGGSVSDALVSLMDLTATCADALAVKLPDDTAEDSVSFLPVLAGKERKARNDLVHHSIDGEFAIREGKWKLCLCPGSGGWSAPRAAKGLPSVQLYDMESGPGETKNLQADHPEVVERLTRLLDKQVADGRSTPGKPQKNTVPVSLPFRARSAP